MIRRPIPESEPHAGATAASGPSDGADPQVKRSANESDFGASIVSAFSSEWNGSKLQRSDLMPYAVRMVTPMRREFDRSMDVTHFLHDMAYAREIIAQAKTSRDARLRGYASFLEIRLLGAPDQETAVVAKVGPAPESIAAATDARGLQDKLPTSEDFARAKAYAAESLSQLLGPPSQRLCRAIASASDMAGFVDVFDRAYSVVRNIHGADEARRYGAAIEARLGGNVSIARKQRR